MPDEHQPDQAEEAARAAAGSPEPLSPEEARPTARQPKQADPGAGGESLLPAPVAPEPEQQPQQQPRHPVRMTPLQERRMRQISRENRSSSWPWPPAWMSKRNHDAPGAPERGPYAPKLLEAVPLLQGAATALQALQRARGGPRLQGVVGEQENPQGGRGVHRRRGPADGHRQPAPAAAEVGVRRAARDVAAGRNTQESGVVGGIM